MRVVIPAVQSCAKTNEFHGIVWVTGVKKVHGNGVAGDAHNIGFPNLGVQDSVIKFQLNGLPGVREVVVGVNGCIGFGLFPTLVQVLPAVSLPVQQTHPHQWDTSISGRFHMVAGQHTQPSRVGVEFGPKSNFCGEIAKHGHG